MLFSLAIAIWLLPAGYSFLISVKDYQPSQGLWGSPWVGFAKYSEFWRSGDGSNAFANSFTLGVWGYLGSLLIGSLAAWFIPRIREKKLRFLALAIVFIPAFIPSVCWVTGIIPKIIQNPASARWRFILVEIVTNVSIVGFAGAVFGMILPIRGFFSGIAWSAVLWVFLCLTPNFEIIHLMRSPIVSMDTMDAYAYRIGIQQGNYNSGAMIQQLKFFLQVLLGGVVCIGIYIVFLRRRKGPIDSVLHDQPQIPFSYWAIPVSALALILFVLFAPTLYLHSYAAELWRQLPMQLVSTALTFLIALAFSWGLIHALRSMNIFICTICAGLLLSFVNPMVGNVNFYTQIGWMRTIFPGIITALFNPSCLLLILLCARLSQMGHLREQSIWWIALLPTSLASARYWGDVLSPTLYLGSQRWIPFGSLLYMQQTNGYGSDALTYLCNLIPSVLFVIVAVYGIFRYVDLDKTPIRSLLPVNGQFQPMRDQSSIQNRNEMETDATPKIIKEDDALEQQGEQE